MTPRILEGLVLLALLGTSCVSIAEDMSSRSGFLEVYESTWNSHDGDALAALFTADADIMMGNLPTIEGCEAISVWWSSYFSRIDQGRKGEFELLSERAIAPGAWLMNVSSKTSGTNDQGEELETRLARGTWVVVEREDVWLIAAMRGLPAEGDHRVAPGTDH